MTTDKPRRFRFSLRTLFVVVTVCGMTLGWTPYQLNWMRERQKVMKWAEAHPGAWGITFTIHPVDAPWGIRILGEPAGPAGMSVTVVTPEDRQMAEKLKRLYPEREVLTLDRDGNHATLTPQP